VNIIILVCLLTLIAAIIIRFGYSSVKFYEGKKEVGFLYYPPKPYLLIEEGEKGFVTKLISLPDLEHPYRVKHHAGFGTAEMGFDIQNGMITKFNSKNDSKVPETLTSISGLVTAKAALVTANATREKANSEISKTTDLIGDIMLLEDQFVVDAIKESMVLLYERVAGVLSGAPSQDLFANPLSRLNLQIEILLRFATIKYPDGELEILIAKLEDYKKKTEEVVSQLKSISGVLKTIGDDSKTFPKDFMFAIEANEGLTAAIKKLKNFYNHAETVTGLYEIEYVNGELSLRKVIF
jgi:hypothetical protein